MSGYSKQTRTRLCLTLLFLLPLLTLSGCEQSTTPTRGKTQLELAIESSIDHIIIPAAKSFENNTAQLNKSIASYCQNLSSRSSLVAAQEQWKSTLESWYKFSPFIFGPAINHPVFETWFYIDSYRKSHEDNKHKIQLDIKNMIESEVADPKEHISKKGFSNVGLLALEVMLFQTLSGSNSTDDILKEYSALSNKCSIAIAYGAELNRRAGIIKQGWTRNYRQTGENYRTLLLSGQLDTVLDDESGKEPATYLFDALAQFYDYVNKRDIANFIAPVAGNFWEAYAYSLKSTKQILEGLNDDDTGFANIMLVSEGADELKALRESLLLHQKAIDTKNIELLKSSAKQLEKNFKNEFADTLGISVGIGFTDGD